MYILLYYISVKLNFHQHYSTFQCHMILQKSFNADLLSMLETVLNVDFITCDWFFDD